MLLLSIFGLLSLSSCKEFNTIDECGCDDPVQELEWLQDLIADIESQSLSEFAWIMRFRYKGEYYFIVGSCCPNCLWAPTYYDCRGNKIEDFEGNEDVMKAWQGKEGRVIWQGGQCAFIQ